MNDVPSAVWSLSTYSWKEAAICLTQSDEPAYWCINTPSETGHRTANGNIVLNELVRRRFTFSVFVL